MIIHFEIREKLPEIAKEIMSSKKWSAQIKEQINGRTVVAIYDQVYRKTTIEIYERVILIKPDWMKSTYRLYTLSDSTWCEYDGSYHTLLKQVLLPTITPKQAIINEKKLNQSVCKEKCSIEDHMIHNQQSSNHEKTIENNRGAKGVPAYSRSSFTRSGYDKFIKYDYIIMYDRKQASNK